MISRSSDRQKAALVRRAALARDTTPHATTEVAEADYASHLADAFPTDAGHTDAAVTVVAPLDPCATQAHLPAEPLGRHGERAAPPHREARPLRPPMGPSRGDALLHAPPPSPRSAARHDGHGRRTLVMTHAPRPPRPVPPPPASPARVASPVLRPAAAAPHPALRHDASRPRPPWAPARAGAAGAAAPQVSAATSRTREAVPSVRMRRALAAVALLVVVAAAAVVRVTSAPPAASAGPASGHAGPAVAASPSSSPSAPQARVAKSPPRAAGEPPPTAPPPSSQGAPRSEPHSAVAARAVDALADGRPLEAATHYEALAAIEGSDPAYAVAARILRAREAP